MIIEHVKQFHRFRENEDLVGRIRTPFDQKFVQDLWERVAWVRLDIIDFGQYIPPIFHKTLGVGSPVRKPVDDRHRSIAGLFHDFVFSVLQSVSANARCINDRPVLRCRSELQIRIRIHFSDLHYEFAKRTRENEREVIWYFEEYSKVREEVGRFHWMAAFRTPW